MRRFIAAMLCLCISTFAIAADPGYKVRYDGGSISTAKTDDDLRLDFQEGKILLFKKKEQVLSIPASSVTEISYGQDVHRRIGAAIGIGVVTLGVGALMALTKSKKHYVGLTWAEGEKKGGFAMQCDKNDYRGILAGLEGVTGKKAVNADTMTVKN